MTIYPKPHHEKLLALLDNQKLPSSDRPRVEQAIKYYERWIALLDRVGTSTYQTDKSLRRLVWLLNKYKFYIDVCLIFDSPNDFLYRQKGQLKLDNTIIEEFMPRLINPSLIPEIETANLEVGPIKSFSSVYFESSLDVPAIGGGLRIRTKDQDFAIGKRLYIKASHSPDFEREVRAETNLAYVAAECKTNLDKTMFQEACATARDVKSAVPGAKYFLLCEWLDMTPLSTAPTDIEQVIILRKAKRLGSSVRKKFSTYQGRQDSRLFYINYLKSKPFRADMFQRFINNIRILFTNEGFNEKDVLELGYF